MRGFLLLFLLAACTEPIRRGLPVDTDPLAGTDASDIPDGDTEPDSTADTDVIGTDDPDTDSDTEPDSDTEQDVDTESDTTDEWDTDTQVDTDTEADTDDPDSEPDACATTCDNPVGVGTMCPGDTVVDRCDAAGNDVTWVCAASGNAVVQDTLYGCTTTSEPGAGTRVCPGDDFIRSCSPIAGGRARMHWRCQGTSNPSGGGFSNIAQDYCTATGGIEAGQHFCPGQVIERDNCSAGAGRAAYICPETAQVGSRFVLDTALSCNAEADEWEPLHRGIRLKRWVSQGHRFRALEVDLCDASVRVAATAYDERAQRTSAWGESAGMMAAVNGGFFLWSPIRPDGCVAFGDGAEWPTSGDTNYRSFLGFGRSNTWLSEAVWVAQPPYPLFEGMQEAVCGDATLVFDGQAIANANPSVRARTGAGYSADKRTLYLLTVDENGSVGLTVNDFAPVMQQLGADYAINLDGGGSTTMWTRPHGVVNVPTSSERTVANHLGVWLEGGPVGYNCPD